jgi:exodeoxyribonuclease VII small subunit
MTESIEVEELSFEQALAELEEIVKKLEAGGLPLDGSLKLFERGQVVAAYCNTQLDKAELRINVLAPEGEAPFELNG